MSFKRIFEFLNKFENIKNHGNNVEMKVAEWCLKKTGLSLKDINVKVRRPNIIISTKNASAKTAIFTAQNSLFEELKNKFGSSAPDKIIFK